MKKRILPALAALLACLALPLTAADFGVTASSLSGLEESSAEAPIGFTEIVRLSAFFSFKAGKAFRMNASGWGDIGYSTASAAFAWGGNLDRLEMILSPLPDDATAKLAVKAGRLRASDPASLVGISRVDGLQAEFSTGQIDLGLDCGYLGLMSKQEMRILLSDSDVLDFENAALYFAPSRLYSAVRFRYVELFAGQDLSALVASQADLRAADAVHSEYGELLLEGPIALGFDYRLGCVYELLHRMAAEDNFTQAMAARLKLGWSDPAIIDSKANLTADWSSGTLGGLSPYAPVCSETAGESLDIVMSSILRYRAAYSCSPAGGLTLGAFFTGFMRAGNDEPDDPEYLEGGANLWLGEEIGGNLSWEPFSDFAVEAKGSCFLPAWGVTFAPEARTRWNASLSVSIDL